VAGENDRHRVLTDVEKFEFLDDTAAPVSPIGW
jgi:hypothetical protein